MLRGIGAVVAGSFACLLAGAAAAQTPNHVYDLNGDTTDLLGGPALTRQGSTIQSATGVTFGGPLALQHSGLRLDNAIGAFTSGGTYSAELFFQFSTVGGYNRVLNSGTHNDNGAYVRDGFANYFEGGPLPGGTAITPNQMVHYVLTRSPTATSLYVDGALAVTRPGALVSSSIIDDLLFFIDDSSEETSGGFVDFIRTYDSALSAADVARLYNGGTPLTSMQLGVTGAVPEPAAWGLMILGFGMVGAAARRRQRLGEARFTARMARIAAGEIE